MDTNALKNQTEHIITVTVNSDRNLRYSKALVMLKYRSREISVMFNIEAVQRSTSVAEWTWRKKRKLDYYLLFGLFPDHEKKDIFSHTVKVHFSPCMRVGNLAKFYYGDVFLKEFRANPDRNPISSMWRLHYLTLARELVQERLNTIMVCLSAIVLLTAVMCAKKLVILFLLLSFVG